MEKTYEKCTRYGCNKNCKDGTPSIIRDGEVIFHALCKDHWNEIKKEMGLNE